MNSLLVSNPKKNQYWSIAEKTLHCFGIFMSTLNLMLDCKNFIRKNS